MKLFISADIEGVCGICSWSETEKTHADHRYFAEEMTAEVASCASAALLGGAEEVLIKDAHDTARNIIPSGLPEECTILRGWATQPCNMMAGAESCQGIAMVGYHSGAYFDGNPLSHTNNRDNLYIKINGEYASEFLINAYYAAYCGIPILFVSGDEALCETAKKLCPGIKTAAVSRGIGGGSISIHPKKANQLIFGEMEQAMKEFMQNTEKTVSAVLPEHFKVEILFKEHTKAKKGAYYLGARLEDPKTVVFETDDYYEVLRFFYFVL